MALRPHGHPSGWILIYFFRPGRPWQRDSNENTDGLLPLYFTKGTTSTFIPPKELQRISEKLNQAPRKTFGRQASLDLFARLPAGAS
ncbi:hypothetical protein Kisp01_42110 [Kineosporia sp. NBRC 101677]|nr:hypothetical protein Kisp01_42110 [Kineosporia sp. NBRC 101677]